MTVFKAALRHTLISFIMLSCLLGIPYFILRDDTGVDTVTSASVVIEQPSGAYVVLINTDRHTDEENLKTWKQFFSGGEIGFLFEDIGCMVPLSDTAGLELAKSFQSRLPENQMTLKTEDPTLLFSKAEYGNFDIVLLSNEAYLAYGAESIAKLPFVDVIKSEGRRE